MAELEEKASKTDVTEIEIEKSIPEWTPSITESLPDFETERRKSIDKTYLLQQLQDADKNPTHAEYAVHFLIELQARKYAFAVEDVLRVFKSATECIEQCILIWRSDILGVSNELPLSSCCPADGSSAKSDQGLTEIGRNVLMISEVLKCLKEEDALTFWTSKQRGVVLELLASCSKGAVKLRRKLGRIKDSLEDRVKNVRRVAIKCNCEITGNLVPPEIYYQWVNEDANLYQTPQSDTTIASAPAPSLENVSIIKEKLFAIKKIATDWVSRIRPTNDTPSLLEAETDNSTIISSVTLDRPVQVYQMEKHVKILHKIDGTRDEEDSSVCEASLTNLVSADSSTSYVNGPVDKVETIPPSTLSKESWTSKPSQKHLETLHTIEANVVHSQKFKTSDYVYDHRESRIKEMPEQDPICENQNTILISPSNSHILEDLGVDHDVKLVSINPVVTNNEPLFTSQPGITTTNQTTMQEHISLIVNANDDMNAVVSKTTMAIRGMESEWLSPESMQNYRKELYQLIDFIVETATLTQNAEFSARIYREDKDQIVSVLDPVLRELTNCFMSLHSLHNLVTMDCQYLKQLVSGFTKGGQVIGDWVSNPSSDEELTDADFNVDVDELFA